MNVPRSTISATDTVGTKTAFQSICKSARMMGSRRRRRLLAAAHDVLDDVAAELVAVLPEVGRVILRDPLVGAREQDVGFEQSLLVELLEERERGAERLGDLLVGGEGEHAPQRVGLLGEAVAVGPLLREGLGELLLVPRRAGRAVGYPGEAAVLLTREQRAGVEVDLG